MHENSETYKAAEKSLTVYIKKCSFEHLPDGGSFCPGSISIAMLSKF